MPHILFVDAYDSFSRNIIALIFQCVPAATVTTIHIDTDISHEYGVDLDQFVDRFDAVVLGPGPGNPQHPSDVGLFTAVLSAAAARHIPLLGICLGFQVLCLRYSHPISKLPMPCHGQPKTIQFYDTDIFQNLRCESDVRVISYNSLGVRKSAFSHYCDEGVPVLRTSASSPVSIASSPGSVSSEESEVQDDLQLLAWDDDGFAMAARHSQLPLWGLQFHPESCASNIGSALVRSWWSAVEKFGCSGICAPLSETRNARPTRDRKIFHPDQVPPYQASYSSPDPARSVVWTKVRLESFTSSQLSRFCYDAAQGGTVGMLESITKGRFCVYSFADNSSTTVTYSSGCLTTAIGNRIVGMEMVSPFEALASVEKKTVSRACEEGSLEVPFWGGWIGYTSYEMGLDLLGVCSSRPRVVPDFTFVFVERSLVLDQKTGDVVIQTIRQDDEAWVLELESKLKRLETKKPNVNASVEVRTLADTLARTHSCLPEHEDYVQKIEACQDQLHAGNSYELCLTAETQLDMPAPTRDTPFQLYCNLKKHNPVPFACFLHFPSISGSSASVGKVHGTTILSSSPEQFLTCSRAGTMDMMPMKGTVQRSPTTSMSDALRILRTPKETAENLMIADLIRHDLYGVVGPHQRQAARSGDKPIEWKDPVSVPALNAVKQFETVYQLVSHIRADPPWSLDVSNLASVIQHNHAALNNVLPPGSMTGAPKKRSCEILQHLEQRNRGIYSGIIGFMDVGGRCSWSVAIRTAFSSEAEDYTQSSTANCEGDETRKIWRIGAGGAVTVLSNIEGEWQEMMGKLGNVLKAFKEVKHEDPQWRPE